MFFAVGSIPLGASLALRPKFRNWFDCCAFVKSCSIYIVYIYFRSLASMIVNDMELKSRFAHNRWSFFHCEIFLQSYTYEI